MKLCLLTAMAQSVSTETSQDQVEISCSSQAAEDRPWWSGLKLHSNLQSVDSGQVSVLALLETICAMTIYAWIAAKHGTLHLTVAACVAPFLLLRTKESTELGLRYSARYFHIADIGSKRVAFLAKVIFVILLPFLLLAILLVFGAKSPWPYLRDGGLVFFMCILAVAALGALTICLVPTAIRATAALVTLIRHPLLSVSSAPSNWFRYVACMDMAHPAELIPGAIFHEARIGCQPTLLNPLNWLRNRQIILSEKKPSEELVLRLLAWPVLVVAAFPAIAYRWSIKGTSLLLFPLAFFVWEAPSAKPQYLKESLAAKGLFGGSCLVLLSFFGSVLRNVTGTDFALAKGYDAIVASASMHPTAAAFFPRGHLSIWQAFVTLGAAIVFLGYLYADRLKNRGHTNRQLRALEIGYYVLGIVVVCTIFGLIFAASGAIRH